jgi:hypothetical protein
VATTTTNRTAVAPETPNSQRLAARGYAPPYTLGQSLAWADQSASFARQDAARYVDGCRRHRDHTNRAERFEAIAEQLRRLDALDHAAATE